MFLTRLLSGIALVALALLFNIRGGILLLLALAAISLIGLYEFYRVMDMETELLAAIGYLFCIVQFVGVYFTARGGTSYLGICILLCLVLMLGLYVFTFPVYKAEQIMTAFFGVIYVPVMLSYIYLTRQALPEGKYLVWLIFLSSWGCDTAAYCAGMLLGKRKLAPVLSPKKSIEGAIGGIVGAALLGLLYALAINHFGAADPVLASGSGRVWKYPLICAFGAVISQVGDLSASGIKRDHDIKDYGKLIPGHGGILDRFDSVIFTAWIIYYLGALLV